MRNKKEERAGPALRGANNSPRGENPAVLAQVLGLRNAPGRNGGERRADAAGKAMVRTRVDRTAKLK